MVSRPTYLGGLGFGYKWDMGFMHDTLHYMSEDPIYRKYHHQQLTFRRMYAYSENFVLPLSHDEVVHGKSSLLGKMAGEDRNKFANLRLLLGYMYAQPGKKLLFMGGEFAQGREWDHDRSLDWHLMDVDRHAGVWTWARDLGQFYRATPALFDLDSDPSGFEWVDCNDWENSVLSFVRRGRGGAPVLAVFNFTPVLRANYRLGVPGGGFWQERLNSDASIYGGSGAGNFGGVEAAPVAAHGHRHSLHLTLPPLSVLFLIPGAGAR
jgi:1,4-alpha-glucan branching enzyme